MNDNDIIKALECCKDADCLNCPRWSEEWHSGMCNGFLQEVVNLINRLKTEIDILCNSLHVSSQNFENMARAMPNIAKATRIEAIKNFAEKLKKECIGDGWFEIEDELLCEMIDNLVKEMTEEQE